MTELELATDEMMGLLRLSKALTNSIEEGMVMDGIVLSIDDSVFNVKLIGVRE